MKCSSQAGNGKKELSNSLRQEKSMHQSPSMAYEIDSALGVIVAPIGSDSIRDVIEDYIFLVVTPHCRQDTRGNVRFNLLDIADKLGVWNQTKNFV
jgi:hypothetical protein